MKMSDPLWFLDNLDKAGNMLEQSTMAETQRGERDPALNQISSEDSNNNLDAKKSEASFKMTPEGFEIEDSSKLLPETTSLKTQLEKSLLDLAKSTDNAQNREIRITLNADDLKGISQGEITNAKTSLNGASNVKVETPQDKQSGIPSGREKNILGVNQLQESTNSSLLANGDNEKQPTKPTIYVILRSNNGKPTEETEKIQLNNPASGTQYCQEVGSAVINLKELFLPQETQASGIANTSAEVNESPQGTAIDAKPKVELVITIKDERKKPSTSSSAYSSLEAQNFPREDVTRFKELLKNSTSVSKVLAENWDSRLKRFSNDFRNTSSWESTSHLETQDNRGQQTEDWSDETKDSYIRDSDGAYCTRTVSMSPRGRKVQVHCYKDQRNHQRGHHYDYYDDRKDYVGMLKKLDDAFLEQFYKVLYRFQRYMYY